MYISEVFFFFSCCKLVFICLFENRNGKSTSAYSTVSVTDMKVPKKRFGRVEGGG